MKKGFTLIELLVVIGIIGILSQITLATVGTVRDKANDAVIKRNLASILTQATIIYDDDGDYDKVCGAHGETQDSIIASLISDTVDASGALVRCGQPTHADTQANAWAVSSQLKSDSDRYWCVDTSGVAAEYSSHVLNTGDFTCDPNTHI